LIIDAHVHLLPREVKEDRSDFCKKDRAFSAIYASEKSRICSEQELIDYMDRSNIEKSIVFGFPWDDPELVEQNNDQILSFHEKFRDRVIPFAVLSSRGDEWAYREAERCLAAGFSGLGELACYEGGWTSDRLEGLQAGLDLASKKRVPVTLHVNEPVGHDYPGKVIVDFNGLIKLIRNNPTLDFILAHFGGGIFVYGLMPEVAEIMKRTYFDTAAAPFLYDSRVWDIAGNIVGPDKILFGSDFPLIGLPRYEREFEKAQINEDFRGRILGGNVAKLLSLASCPESLK
jgi:uncharacterized protein